MQLNTPAHAFLRCRVRTSRLIAGPVPLHLSPQRVLRLRRCRKLLPRPPAFAQQRTSGGWTHGGLRSACPDALGEQRIAAASIMREHAHADTRTRGDLDRAHPPVGGHVAARKPLRKRVHPPTPGGGECVERAPQ